MSTTHHTAGRVGRSAMSARRPAPRRPTARRRAPQWRSRLRVAVIAVDLSVILVTDTVALATNVVGRGHLGLSATYGGLSTLLAVVLLAVTHAWDPQVVGQGAEEFNRVARAFAGATLLLAFTGVAAQAGGLRPWILGVLPLTGLLVVVARYGTRRVLHAARRRGACMSSVLVVGSEASVVDLVARTRRVPHHGWTVVAACAPAGPVEGPGATIAGVPVVGDLDAAGHAAGTVDVVAVAPAPGWSPSRLQALAWQLEGTGVDLVVDPGLMEIGGPRLHVAPVDGLPMLRLTEPRLGGVVRAAKGAVDRVVAAVLLVLLAPLLLTIAVLVRRDGGPVLFWQERIGRRGATFRMLKFRSMVVDAEGRSDDLDHHDGAGPLFKLRADPRVTRIGAVLRRHSLDELPQLVNVLVGSMSLVGPRPPLPREVATYADAARRKLLVRPGITGLWQVSGRSDLTWEESVRLDLRYVENWSPALDAFILWKTVGAVVHGRGAY